MLLRRYKVIASAVGQAVWVVTPLVVRDPKPPTDDVDYLLDFEEIDYAGEARPEAMDGIITWVENLVSIIRRLTAGVHVSLPVGLHVGCSVIAVWSRAVWQRARQQVPALSML